MFRLTRIFTSFFPVFLHNIAASIWDQFPSVWNNPLDLYLINMFWCRILTVLFQSLFYPFSWQIFLFFAKYTLLSWQSLWCTWKESYHCLPSVRADKSSGSLVVFHPAFSGFGVLYFHTDMISSYLPSLRIVEIPKLVDWCLLSAIVFSNTRMLLLLYSLSPPSGTLVSNQHVVGYLTLPFIRLVS